MKADVTDHPEEIRAGKACSLESGVETPISSSADEILCPRRDLIYDLRLDNRTSDAYYADAARFSLYLIEQIEKRAARLLDGYSNHVQSFLCERPRSRSEYALDLLTLGLALRRYRGAAEATPGWVVALAREIDWIRSRSGRVKPFSNRLRAVLTRFFLAPRIETRPTQPIPTLQQLPRLIEWLQATGDFTQESMRVNNWRGYLATLPTKDANEWLKSSIEIFDWFQQQAHTALGAYTQGVEIFLKQELAQRGCRGDRLLCGRAPVEYHLGMVAAEIMNQGMRSQYLQTSRRVVLVPYCLRGASSSKCQARVYGVDIVCSGCTPECTVNQITQRMKAQNVSVYLVPHNSDFHHWLDRWQREPDMGVTAIACLANIVSGGYEMRSRRIASQCALLDYPGCQQHWRSQGIATDLNVEHLVQIVGVSKSGNPRL
jgi:hypothetical protein